MQVWGLYSSYVDPYHPWMLLQVFADEELARRVKAMLLGKPQNRWGITDWREDPEDPEDDDLHVLPIEVWE